MGLSMYKQDTIAALATNPVNSALAVIRVSGPGSHSVFNRMAKIKTVIYRHAYSVKLYSIENNTLLDSVVCIVYKGPNSYTGEDSLEIISHGGIIVSESILSDLFSFDIRPASPGEFSLRAYLNNKIDLGEAVSIDGIINSQSKKELSYYLNKTQEGNALDALHSIRRKTFKLLTIIENELNFSEEEITHISMSHFKNEVQGIIDTIKNITEATLYGKESYKGRRIAIIGKPNVGKSTLFNSLLGINRAITSNKPGTTRDTVEGWIEINGTRVCIVDTAGIWESLDFIEGKGIERTISEALRSDYIIVADDNNPSEISTMLVNEHNIQRTIIIEVITKSDLSKNLSTTTKMIKTSSKNNKGIKTLINMLSTLFLTNCSDVDMHLPVSAMQLALLKKSLESLVLVSTMISDKYSMDIIASELRQFIEIIERVVGVIPDDDIVNNIFSNFCVGK